jgi:hypothetical protein
MQEEITAIKKNNTWFLTELPSGKVPINIKWVIQYSLLMQ